MRESRALETELTPDFIPVGIPSHLGKLYERSIRYLAYDARDTPSLLFSGSRDDWLPLMERIVGISVEDEEIAYSFEELRTQRVVNDIVGGEPVVVFWQAGTASALDQRSIADSTDVGSAGGYRRVVDGRALSFAASDNRFVDEQTGSTWNIFGHATAGPLSGRQLEPIVHAEHFWFVWVTLRPDTEVYSSD